MTFIDTNYFLRFLLEDEGAQQDISAQQAEAVKLFKAGARGEAELLTSTIVFFEIFWVLTSFYEKSKTEVITILKSVLEMSFIELEERPVLEKAVKLYQEQNVKLEDCYNLAYAQDRKTTEFATFDQKLAGVTDAFFALR